MAPYENFLVGHSELQFEFASHFILTGHSDVVMGVIITNRDDIYEKLKFLQNGELIQIRPLSTNPTKWSNTLKQFVGNLLTNCLSVFDHFEELALKGLIRYICFSG